LVKVHYYKDKVDYKKLFIPFKTTGAMFPEEVLVQKTFSNVQMQFNQAMLLEILQRDSDM
jgi:hypothetical protein